MLAGAGGELAGHPPVERAADLEPPAVSLAIAGEKCCFRLLPRTMCGSETVLCEMTQGGMQHRIAGSLATVVVRRQATDLANLPRTQKWGEGVGRGGESDSHGSVRLLTGGRLSAHALP